MPKRYKLKHGTYRVEYAQIDGLCELGEQASAALHTITIDPRLRGKNRLKTILHEALHAACPTMSEEEVTRISDEQGEIAWGEGYRGSK